MIPAPPIEAQHRFNSLLAKARRARSIREETSKEVEALTSAVLREAFGNV